jgi:hypothetical protein
MYDRQNLLVHNLLHPYYVNVVLIQASVCSELQYLYSICRLQVMQAESTDPVQKFFLDMAFIFSQNIFDLQYNYVDHELRTKLQLKYGTKTEH